MQCLGKTGPPTLLSKRMLLFNRIGPVCNPKKKNAILFCLVSTTTCGTPRKRVLSCFTRFSIFPVIRGAAGERAQVTCCEAGTGCTTGA